MRTVILSAATFNADARTLKAAPLRDPRDPARPKRLERMQNEHERFMGLFRGLIGQWIKERGATATLSE